MPFTPSAALTTLAYIPSPTVSYFKIGPFTIRFYALTMMCSIWFAVWILTHRWRKLGGTFEQVTDIAVAAVPLGLIGARIYNCLTVPFDYFGPTGSLINILKIWRGGMAIFGALLGGFLGAAIMCHHRKIPVLLLGDAVAPGLLIAQSFGRLGNWINQELYGLPTTWPWGLKLNSANAIGKYETCYENSPCPDPQTTLFQPTFLYSIIWCLLGAALIVHFGNKYANRLKGGQIFAAYLIWYGIGRAAIEQIRINSSAYFLGVRINTWIAGVTALVGIVLYSELQRSGLSRASLQRKLALVTQRDRQQCLKEKKDDEERRVRRQVKKQEKKQGRAGR